MRKQLPSSFKRRAATEDEDKVLSAQQAVPSEAVNVPNREDNYPKALLSRDYEQYENITSVVHLN